MELHVFIEVMAPIPEAYMRMAHAMEEVKKFLIPVRISSLASLQKHFVYFGLTITFQICK